MELQGKRGEGAFQWNWGGWFGSQVGATLWLVILGIVLLARPQAHEGAGGSVGWLVVLAGVVPNLVGLALWRRRHSLSPYPAIQILIAVCGLAALFAMLCIGASSVTRASAGLPSAWFLLMYPGLMLGFHTMELAQRKAGA